MSKFLLVVNVLSVIAFVGFASQAYLFQQDTGDYLTKSTIPNLMTTVAAPFLKKADTDKLFYSQSELDRLFAHPDALRDLPKNRRYLVDSGIYVAPCGDQVCPWKNNPRWTEAITFATPFTGVPVVLLSFPTIYDASATNRTNRVFDVVAADVTKTGFTLKPTTGSSSAQQALTVHWLAIGVV